MGQVAAVLAGHLQQATAAGRELTGDQVADLVYQPVPPEPADTPRWSVRG
ncbi:MAG TPA: hypothetical protein VHJ17_21440 [Thermomonospora sp.]|nr:hypothetical protein [Thermomonospora sp.]